MITIPPSSLHDHSTDSLAELPCPRPSDWPSQLLRAGFVRYEDDDGWCWVYVQADQPIYPSDLPVSQQDLDWRFGREPTRTLLRRLAQTFDPFVPAATRQWEEGLRQSPCPRTLLCLWETMLGLFDYYVTGKKHLAGADTDYFWLLVNFCNAGGSPDALQAQSFLSLKPGRVQRVIAELQRWFGLKKVSGGEVESVYIA